MVEKNERAAPPPPAHLFARIQRNKRPNIFVFPALGFERQKTMGGKAEITNSSNSKARRRSAPTSFSYNFGRWDSALLLLAATDWTKPYDLVGDPLFII